NDVLGRRALLGLDDLELHALPLRERPEALALDGRVVDEAILRAVLRGDEPEALRLVEPLHGTGRTHSRTPVLVSDCRGPGDPYQPTVDSSRVLTPRAGQRKRTLEVSLWGPLPSPVRSSGCRD